MSQLTKWFKKTVEKLVDPDKDERLQTLVRVLQHGLSAKREQFTLSEAIRGLDYKPKDLEAAKLQVFSAILARGWNDGTLTAEEQKVAQWVVERLDISPSKAREINLDFAREHFLRALAEAMEEGSLNSQKETKLRAIADSVGFSLPDFARAFFRQEGEAFLRNIFSASLADGHISQSEWDCLLSTTKRIGISNQEMLNAIQPDATRFVEHVLADAKADGKISLQEDAALRWMVDNFALPADFRKYLEQEAAVLRLLTEITEGRLPSIAAPTGMEIRSGEIVHFFCGAIWRQMRLLKSGMRYDDHTGILMFTDHRLIFSSPSKSHNIGYRKIVSHQGADGVIEVHVESKPTNVFRLSKPSPVPYAVFSAAVAMANQTKVVTLQGSPTRHIPREVRQRVWQRYGGRCAECSATDYLEFDHVIPVARGGSNSDSNVQLLCRRCNLRKSDAI